jgi:hypothetical protein
MTKPKKALRSLFARTEPVEATVSSPEIIEAPQTLANDVTSHHEAVEAQPLAEVAAQVEARAEALAPTEETHAFVASVTHAESVSAFLDFTEERIEFAPIQDWDAIAMSDVNALESSIAAFAPITPEVHNANVAAAVLNIQYNFEVGRVERETWREPEYVEFIRRIDVAQAEAFFLKGKLLGEVKDRFYVENRTGWKGFSENTLGMNYTTVNQYIRVAQEFDVTSHRRPDFGFEHYKALLPLKLDERAKLLEELPQVSVKELRTIVQRKLMEEGTTPVRPQRSQQSKELIELLIDLKTKIFDCAPETMTQRERWQLTAACRNLADDLASAARGFNDFGKTRSDAAGRVQMETQDCVEAGV